MIPSAVKQCFNLTVDCSTDVAVMQEQAPTVSSSLTKTFAVCLSGASRVDCQMGLGAALKTVLDYEDALNTALNACILGPLLQQVRIF